VATSHTQAPPPLLLLTPIRGASDVTVHNGTATGRLRFDGTLQHGGEPLAIRGRRLWVQITSPANLRIEIRGHVAHVPGTRPQVIVVTATGWRPA
jgi:hypothetical protein